MLSRVAERLYWMSRYIERSENTARLLNVYALLMLDLPRGVGIHWRQLVQISGGHELFYGNYRSDGEANVLKFVAQDPANPGSLLSSLAQARENVRTTRDQIPSEAWQAINELYLYGRRRLAADNFRKVRHKVLSEIVSHCQQTAGLLAGAMSRGPGYQFVRIGRHIERADMTTRIIDVGSTTLIAGSAERERLANRLWMHILRALSAYQMYRLDVRRRIHRDSVIEYLLRDARFPRSVAHALSQLEECFGQLPNYVGPLQPVKRLAALVASQDLKALSDGDLHELMDNIQLELGQTHQIIESTWFLPAPDETA